MTARHAHELEAAGEPRWKARLKDKLLLVTDLASGEEHQVSAYTADSGSIRFALPGDNGLRQLNLGQPGYDDFMKVIEKSPQAAPAAPPGSKPANEKSVSGAKAA